MTFWFSADAGGCRFQRSTASLHSFTPTSTAALAATRKLHRDLLENGLAQFDDCKKKPKTVQVEQAYGPAVLPVRLAE